MKNSRYIVIATCRGALCVGAACPPLGISIRKARVVKRFATGASNNGI
jgi:hypothetical protein